MKTLFVALDFKTEQETFAFLDKFEVQSIGVKVGMSQFYMSGPKIIEEMCRRGHEVFLDLKCHDIPNTVYLACLQLSQLPVKLLTVHTLGGKEMMQAAVKGVEEGPYQPQILGITQLTSTNQTQLNQDLGISGDLQSSVIHLAQLAEESGLAGVVSSVQEVSQIKAATSERFLSLTPGIRMQTNATNDQKRVATPEQARLAGADFIVVGRPITQSSDPVAAYQEFIHQWKGSNN